MSEYIAPIRDMSFAINELGMLERVNCLPGFEEATSDLVDAVLEEAGKLAAAVLSPLNRVGDEQGAQWHEHGVRTPDGWKEAYDLYVKGGWTGLVFDPVYGGQGLPKLISTAVSEMWSSANLAFALCPLLTQGAIEAIEHHGSDPLKSTYLPKLVAGVWTGTMNLTEPQAGSDLSAVRTRAVGEGDHYRITGQKIFITYGEHDLTENIIHLVLARLPDAPEGVRGISLFVVPKILVKDDGSLGEPNDLRCVSIEHKLGIHASPTSTMSYGDNGGAIGYLVGEQNRGLEYMFTMMNVARHAVGLEGVSISERAYQQALEYARERVQGQPLGNGSRDTATIIEHPDVRRMLLTMKSQVEAMRALAYECAVAFDIGGRHPDREQREYAARRGDLLTPIVKGWCTETCQELTSLGVQIHGGMGYVEETGAAQYFRDARITTIYEGTTGIQAADIVGRKTLRDGGAAARELLNEIQGVADSLSVSSDARVEIVRSSLNDAVAGLTDVLAWLFEAEGRDPRLSGAASAHYLKLWGIVAGGWQMGRAARASAARVESGSGDAGFYEAKLDLAYFYATQIMPQAGALKATIINGSAAVLAPDMALFT